jgi:4-amino-4-deoxy-L-arabinose transferase-like glycosyltransferase
VTASTENTDNPPGAELAPAASNSTSGPGSTTTGRHHQVAVSEAASPAGAGSAVLTAERPAYGATNGASAGRPPFLRRLVRGRPEDPAWVRPTLWLILAVAAVLYLWDLGASGWSNDFYAAAVQAGTKSWKAFFFGSSDWYNVITVDKPPASLWAMELSGRIFGFNSWSMLAPEAIEGVIAVYLLYAAVRRWAGAATGLAAAAMFALTPVAVLMFRFNNPDALLVMLEVLAAYCIVRAFDAAATRAGTRWIVLAGVVMGFAFLTKTLAAFLVMPAFALVYLLFAPTGLWRRVWQLLLSGAGLIVGAGWWLLATVLTPAADRPYFGGSGDNTALGLAFGYNGIQRIAGSGGSGPGGGGGGGGMFGGTTGYSRLFNSQMGTQIAWLLPAALIALVAALWITRRAPRVDTARAGLVLWGGWMVVTAGVFSYMQGIFHSYYNVALAPGIAAALAVGARELWLARDQIAARIVLAVVVGVTAWTEFDLLGRAADWNPWLRWAVVVASVLAIVALVLGAKALRRVAVVGVVVGAIAALAGPAAFAVETAGTPHTGSTPTAGPATTGGNGGFGGGNFGNRGTREGNFGGGQFPGGGTQRGTGTGTGTGNQQGMGNQNGGTGTTPGGTTPGGTTGTTPGGTTSGTGTAGNRGGFGGGAADSALIALLKKSTTQWAAAANGSQSASTLQLDSGQAVISIGGFSGSDPAPTLAQFKKWVAEGKIHYYVGGGMGGGFTQPTTTTGTTPGGTTSGGNRGGFGGDRGTSSSISTWVEANFTAVTVGSQTVYDLTKPKAS